MSRLSYTDDRMAKAMLELIGAAEAQDVVIEGITLTFKRLPLEKRTPVGTLFGVNITEVER